MNLMLPQPGDCTACGYCDPLLGGSRPSSACLTISLCPNCGHLMALEPNGNRRNLSAAEKLNLRNHAYAAKIRQAQEETVERLIG